MRRKLALLFSLIGWFAVITQFVLMVDNRVTTVFEVIVRFISFFTILTNTLVAIYFTFIAIYKPSKWVHKPGTLTAITIYITLVGLVYQIALRHLWRPHGLQMVVDELLHSVIPILVIIFWYMYEKTNPIHYSQILKWAVYPVLYEVYILIRGSISNFYPYPFVDVTTLGLAAVLTNSVVLLLLFMLISTLFLFVGKTIIKR